MKKEKLFTAIGLISCILISSSSYGKCSTKSVVAKESVKIDENLMGSLKGLKVNNNINLHLEQEPQGSFISLGWDKPEENHKYEYGLYARNKSNDKEELHSIPIKGSVRVLNIYPGYGNSLKRWMGEPALRKCKESETPDVTYKTLVLEAGDNYSWKDQSYKYIKEGRNFITNGRGYIKPDDTDLNTPKKNESGNYEYVEGTTPLITVEEEITVDEFNKLCEGYGNSDFKNPLKDENNDYKFDVIYEGAWDCNKWKDLTESASSVIRNYIKSGRGYLSGHDTLWGDKMPVREEMLKNMCMLKDGEANYGYNEVKCNNAGCLLNYPWSINSTADINCGENINNDFTLNVPFSHTTGVLSKGDVWLKYVKNSMNDNKEIKEDGYTNNFYLVTYNNVAQIQTGHLTCRGIYKNLIGVYRQNDKTEGLKTYDNIRGDLLEEKIKLYGLPEEEAKIAREGSDWGSPDEKRILANTIFYLSQVTADTHWEDHYCQDIDAPNAPNVEIDVDNGELNLGLKDNGDIGTTYQFIIRAREVCGNHNPAEDVISNTLETTNTSNVDKFLVICDKNDSTKINEVITDNINNGKNPYEGIYVKEIEKCNEGEKINLNLNTDEIKELVKDNFKVHVAVIDKAGNLSETTTVKHDYSIILNVEDIAQAKDQKVIEGSKVNRELTVQNIKDITEQNIVIKYDTSKLNFLGLNNVGDNIIVSDFHKDKENGTITLTLLGNTENNEIIEKTNLLNLCFKTIGEGETYIIVDKGIIKDKYSQQRELLKPEKGYEKINIIK